MNNYNPFREKFFMNAEGRIVFSNNTPTPNVSSHETPEESDETDAARAAREARDAGANEVTETSRVERTSVAEATETNPEAILNAQKQCISAIAEAQDKFREADLQPGFGKGAIQDRIDQLDRLYDSKYNAPDKTASYFLVLKSVAEDVVSQIEEWIRHKSIMDKIAERNLSDNNQVIEIRRKLTQGGGDNSNRERGVETHKIKEHNDDLQKILDDNNEPAESATGDESATETPDEQTQPQAPAQTPEFVEREDTLISKLGGDKAIRFLKKHKWLTAIFSVIPASLLGFFASHRQLRALGIRPEGPDLSGTEVGLWARISSGAEELQQIKTADDRLRDLGFKKSTRAKIRDLNVVDMFAGDFDPKKITTDTRELGIIARLKDTLVQNGARGNEETEIGEFIAARSDADWRQAPRQEMAQNNQNPAENADAPAQTPGQTPEQKTETLFQSFKIDTTINMNDEGIAHLKNMKAKLVSSADAIRPTDNPQIAQAAWEKIRAALTTFANEITDENMTVEAFLTKKFREDPTFSVPAAQHASS